MSSCCPHTPDQRQTCSSPKPVVAEHGLCEHPPHEDRQAYSPDTAAALASSMTAIAIPKGFVSSSLRISQMDCPTEEALIRKKLGAMSEVAALEFNLMQRVLTVVHRAETLPTVTAGIRSLGMTPQVLSPGLPVAELPISRKWPLLVAGLAAIGAEALHWAGIPSTWVALLALLSIAVCGISTYRKGWIALRNGELNINALMSIAVTGALLIGQWPEAAVVMFLFTLAELIEAKSLDRARNAIRGLLQLAPEQALVRQADGRWVEMAANVVRVADIIRVAPGERIALDGVLQSGQSTVNQAAITGESLPVEKTVGDTVFAGTINQSGSFEYRVSETASHSTLARIIHAIEAAQSKKAPSQRFVDRFAQIYTPLVLVIALAIAFLPPLLLGGDWRDWVYKALVLLVIACPCALVISTPVTIVSGLAQAARHGILIKGGVYLELGRKLSWLALDKTGTLTHGKPVQTDFELFDGRNVDARAVAASLAARSDHPISKALAAAHKASLEVDHFEALPGRGVKGQIGGHEYLLGNQRFIQEKALFSETLNARLSQLEQQGKTVVLLADENGVIAIFALADTIKPGSRAAVEALHQLGIQTTILSGDNRHTVQTIAKQLGIDHAHGDQLPHDKLKAIEFLTQTGVVGMVGDGINDAPALARADIGFAMGVMGSDTAIETADVALMDDDLGKLASFVKLSQATHAILVQNIVLALGIKAVFLVLTLLGMGSMWMAVFADMGASLLVVGNGLRLLRK